jgi:hypothetical protein
VGPTARKNSLQPVIQFKRADNAHPGSTGKGLGTNTVRINRRFRAT